MLSQYSEVVNTFVLCLTVFNEKSYSLIFRCYFSVHCILLIFIFDKHVLGDKLQFSCPSRIVLYVGNFHTISKSYPFSFALLHLSLVLSDKRCWFCI